jgi:hypothetical protein
MGSPDEMDINATSNPVQRDGFGPAPNGGSAPNGGRVTVMETVGSPVGSTSIHNPSNNNRQMVSQRLEEGLVGNVDLATQM